MTKCHGGRGEILKQSKDLRGKTREIQIKCVFLFLVMFQGWVLGCNKRIVAVRC